MTQPDVLEAMSPRIRLEEGSMKGLISRTLSPPGPRAPSRRRHTSTQSVPLLHPDRGRSAPVPGLLGRPAGPCKDSPTGLVSHIPARGLWPLMISGGGADTSEGIARCSGIEAGLASRRQRPCGWSARRPGNGFDASFANEHVQSVAGAALERRSSHERIAMGFARRSGTRIPKWRWVEQHN
jgi:hypothetical protein